MVVIYLQVGRNDSCVNIRWHHLGKTSCHRYLYCVLHVSRVQQATVFLFCVQVEWCRWSSIHYSQIKGNHYQYVVLKPCVTTCQLLFCCSVMMTLFFTWLLCLQTVEKYFERKTVIPKICHIYLQIGEQVWVSYKTNWRLLQTQTQGIQCKVVTFYV